MIHIDRNRNDENDDPIQPNAAWFAQAVTARTNAFREKKDHEADDNVYAHTQVRVALEKLFHDKCAYCETKTNAGADWDVEHYRPKGKVAERDPHPGYYWLAYTWTNLYPSCEHCNQRRKDKPRWGHLRMGPTRGKLDQFPLDDEQHRAMSHNDNLSLEDPLLIDPCGQKNPEELLGYDIMGQIFAVGDNKYAKATIDICGLKRQRLRDARLDIVNSVIMLTTMLLKHQTSRNLAALADLQRIMDTMLLGDHCLYAGTARYVRNNPNLFGL